MPEPKSIETKELPLYLDATIAMAMTAFAMSVAQLGASEEFADKYGNTLYNRFRAQGFDELTSKHVAKKIAEVLKNSMKEAQACLAIKK